MGEMGEDAQKTQTSRCNISEDAMYKMTIFNNVCVCTHWLSHVQLFATAWTVAH